MITIYKKELFPFIIVITCMDFIKKQEDLKKFIQKNHYYPKYSDDKELYYFVNKTRLDYKKGKLNSDQIEALKSIDFIFSMQDYVWNQKFRRLITYLCKHNNQYPSSGTALGSFVSVCRNQAKKGILNHYRMKMLKSIKFQFNKQDSNWYSNLNKLLDHLEKHDGRYPRMGNRKKLKAYDSETSKWIDENRKNEYLLGKWVMAQRSVIKNGKISDSRKKILDDIGFAIDGYQEKWEYTYYRLFNYIDIIGHIPSIKDDQNLNTWFYHNLKLSKIQKLNSFRLSLFNALISIMPDDFEKTNHKTWDERYQELIEFIQNYNRLPMLRRNKSNKRLYEENSLAGWLSHQKSLWRKDMLHNDKYQKLLKVDVEFKIINRNRDWMTNYISYVRFKQINEREPKSNINSERDLYQWCAYNRSLKNGGYRGRRLPDNRFSLLKEINFIF